MNSDKKKHFLKENANNDNYNGSGNDRQIDFDTNNDILCNKCFYINFFNINNNYQFSNKYRYLRDYVIRITIH